MDKFNIYDDLRDIVKTITADKKEYDLVCEEITKHFEGWTPLMQDLHPKAQCALMEWEEMERMI